ncbi:hypothetical protein PF005_g27042 [Phytophthora fragariae]|uniref:RXLR phytopathogen effector protein WY-domain domain-containing protein n=1 Tax=Phytophthora fragariae TaxID=53985 RepID=A0A6A3W6B1_9STRA|nr:hypothetical protein PF003_g30583 [Phytophthora fragariae]KAE8922025.1 hypothetical protein PF009_g27703 [Phytophthora fragariae]KAE8971373.1 hypothetical protein PF011_g26057 [Phytophthora fragariae]KAE9069246.1 hypothetical protein PF010_g26734 [Phytophthora fragariae]KAE9070058.1 hypothetical protein PF007_g27079 [Phytophthora fragariae]
MLIYAQKVPRTKRFAARTLEDLWISQDKTADDIFKLLKLDQRGKNLFDRGELSTWVSYVTKLNKLDEKPDEFAVLIELQKRFGNLELAKMFSAALKNSGPNNDLISSLQTLQFKRWLADGTTPNSLNTMLSKTPILGGFDFRSVDVHLRYLDFYRANK